MKRSLFHPESVFLHATALSKLLHREAAPLFVPLTDFVSRVTAMARAFKITGALLFTSAQLQYLFFPPLKQDTPLSYHSCETRNDGFRLRETAA